MPHIWSPRIRLTYRSRGGDRHHEPGALFPSAPVRPVSELPILAGPKHRAKSVSPYDLRTISAYGHSRRIRKSERVRRLPEIAGIDQLHRQCEEDLVGRSVASVFRHDRVPHL